MGLKMSLAVVDQKQRLINQARPLPKTTLQSLEDDFTIRYSHHTTAIEGNTLTLSETQVVIEDGLAIGGKTLREHLEVLNMRDALTLLRKVVQQADPITDQTILEMQRIIMSGILKEEVGFYRHQPIYIRGASHVPPNWVKVPALMEDFSRRLAAGHGERHPVAFAADMHLDLVRIHPFVDGNGALHGCLPILFSCGPAATRPRCTQLGNELSTSTRFVKQTLVIVTVLLS